MYVKLCETLLNVCSNLNKFYVIQSNIRFNDLGEGLKK